MVHKIEAPFLWFSQLITGTPKPWKHFKIDGLMINAYEILQKKRANLEIREKGIHNYLQFKGPVAMDSGGFLFMKKKMLNVHPQTILELYQQGKPNYGVVLDHPIGPNLPSTEKKRRQLKTLENTQYMLKSLKEINPQLIPVIHGHSIRSIKWYIKRLQKIGDFDIYGIGSLVPSVFNSKGAGGIQNVVKIVSFMRNFFSEKKIHVFGIGSTLTMHLMFYMGVDSIDSSAWRTKAAFGAIQLPRVGDRYITPKKKHKKYRNLSKSERKILEDCGCPACKHSCLNDLIKSFQLRALHNAWVFQNEIKTARKLIVKNDYENYVKEVLTNTPFSNVFKYATKLKATVQAD